MLVQNHVFGQAMALAARRERCPEPGPDDACDPDQPDSGRGRGGGPDDTSDPDFGGRGGGDTYSGPDGTYSYDAYH